MNSKASLLIRRANADDAAALAELGARTFRDTFAADNTPEDMNAYLAASFNPALQLEEIADPTSFILIAEVDGIATGYSKMQSKPAPACVGDPNAIELARLYISQAMIGRGVGAALMEASIREAQLAGYKTMWLGVWERNERAQRFYERWGFREVGEHIFQLGSDAQRDLLMEREL